MRLAAGGVSLAESLCRRSPLALLVLFATLSTAIRPVRDGGSAESGAGEGRRAVEAEGGPKRPNRITAPLVPEKPEAQAPPPSETSFPKPSLVPPPKLTPKGSPTSRPVESSSPESEAEKANETAAETGAGGEARGSAEEEDPPIDEFSIWTQKKLEEQQAQRSQHNVVLVTPDGTGHLSDKPQAPGPSTRPDPAQPPPKPPSESAGESAAVEGAKEPAETPAAPVDVQAVQAVQATQRNYASAECGAKILLTNAESQHSAAVLNEKERDAYLLNPCNAPQRFFFVELCDTVRPTRLDLANFELFSSGPKEVRVLGSERYPSQDWTLLASVSADDNRHIQSFPIAVPPQTYVKHLKVELLSHHGSEHFCPLSLIRLFGVSMVEILDDLEDDAPRVPAPSQPVAAPMSSSQGTSSEARPPELPVSSPPPPEGNIIHKATEMVRGVINKVLGNRSEMSNATLNGSAECGGPRGNVSERSLLFWYRTCLISPPLDRSLCHYFAPTPILLNVTSNGDAETLIHSAQSSGDKDGEDGEERGGTGGAQRRPPLQPLHRPTFPHSLRVRRYDQFQRLMAQLKADKREAERAAKGQAQTPPQVAQSADPIKVNDSLALQSANVLPGGPLNPKESLFVRLSNRIKMLEQNISLSGQYLSELSKRYRKTLEDIQRQYNRTMREVNETRQSADAGLVELAEETEALRAELDDLAAANRLFRQHQLFVQEELWKVLLAVLLASSAASLFLAWLCSVRSSSIVPAPSAPSAPATSVQEEHSQAIQRMERELELLRALVQNHPGLGLRKGHATDWQRPPPEQPTPSSEEALGEEASEAESDPLYPADDPGEPAEPQRLPSEDLTLAVSATPPPSPSRSPAPRAASESPPRPRPDTPPRQATGPRPVARASPAWDLPRPRRSKAPPRPPPSPRLSDDNSFRLLPTTPDRATKAHWD